MKTLVSILIPCYNAKKWLAETLESALSQTWENIEIILVDDGSTDGSLAIAQQFESSKVKVISQLNQGASIARNLALKQAQGEFIQYLDADDLLSPRKIEDQVLLLQQSPAQMLAICGTVHFFDGQNPDNGIYEAGFPLLVDSDTPIGWLLNLFGANNNMAGMVHPAAWLTPRQVADVAGVWDESLSLDDDGEYFARVVLTSNGIRRSDTALSYYRRYTTAISLSCQSSERHHLSALRAVDSKAHNILKLTNSAIAKKVLARAYMDRAILSYPDYPLISDLALKKVQEMGGTNWLPTMGGKQTELIKKLFGWKMARMINVSYRRFFRGKH